MKPSQKEVKEIGIVLLLLANAYVVNSATGIASLVLVGVLYYFLHSYNAVLLGLVASLAVNYYLGTRRPKEGFQAKDPVSVSQRLQQVQQKAPLAPKVPNPVGVLDSPEILDNLTVSPGGAPPAGTAEVLPAPAGSRQLIRPPAESSVPATGTLDTVPMANPVLQNGPDSQAVNAAMISTGTALPPMPAGSNAAGLTAGAGPAF
jgi:hypothetical protein